MPLLERNSAGELSLTKNYVGDNIPRALGSRTTANDGSEQSQLSSFGQQTPTIEIA
jgi:hypothetical protein